MRWRFELRVLLDQEFAAAALGAGLAGTLLFACFSYLVLPDTGRVLYVGIPAAGVLYCAVTLERLGYSAGAPIIRKLGDASYMLYLSHPFIVGLFSLAFHRLGGGAALAGVLIIGALMATSAAALLLHALVEKPLTNWLRRRLPGVSSPAALAIPKLALERP